MSARTQLYPVRLVDGTQGERVRLICPNGHEVVSAPAITRTGQRLVAGDYSREDCGVTSCDWRG